MKNGNSTAIFQRLAVALLLCAVIAIFGCEKQSSTVTGPQPTVSKVDVDGIRVNGTEFTEIHPPQRTFEAWFGGTKLAGPSPLGNFWTRHEADIALNRAKMGIK